MHFPPKSDISMLLSRINQLLGSFIFQESEKADKENTLSPTNKPTKGSRKGLKRSASKEVNAVKAQRVCMLTNQN